MTLSLEDVEYSARKRAGGRCEHTHYEGALLRKKEIRCPEIQGKYAVNYKGRVNLLVVRIGKINDNRPEKLKVLCWRHALKKELSKKKRQPRPKKTDEEQIDIFLGITE